MNLSPFQRRLAGAAAFSVLVFAGARPAVAQPSAEIVFDIPAATLGDALRTFGAQSGTSVAFAESAVAGRTSRGVSGDMPAEAALAVLLEGSGLEAVPGAGGYSIRAQTSTPSSARPKPATPAEPERLPSADPDEIAEASDEADLRISRVTVTGTSLRGFAPESSPLQVYSREDILASGVTTTDQFIRTLPQNFGGGSSEFAPNGVPGDDNVRFNNSFGTGANLRGLGSGATLTLLNGRRLAPTSRIGDFVDLSMIPFSALERVDVLSDGASAIYGGDAVAGVVNFVLRDDFDGGETSLRYGSVTKGEMEEVRFSQALGRSWSSGNVLATYEYLDRSELALADRPDIPLAPTMTGLAAFHNLLPEQTRHSALLSVSQQFGASLDTSLTGLFSERSTDNLSVTNGRTVEGAAATSRLYSVSAGATYEITSSWSAALDGVYSRTEGEDELQQFAPVPRPFGGRQTESELMSVDLVLSGDLLALPGGTVQLAMGGHLRQESLLTRFTLPGAAPVDENDDSRDIVALYGEVLIPLAGAGNGRPSLRRLDFSASARLDDYSDFGSTLNPKVGVLWSPAEGFHLRTSYSESFAPPALGRTGDLRRTAQILPFATVLELTGRDLSDPSLAGVDYMQTSGTAANLDPETSQTWTAGIDYEGHAGPHTWTARASYYDIAFTGRLGSTPRPGNVSLLLAPFIALETPGAFPEGTVIFDPDPGYIEDLAGAFTRPPTYLYGASDLSNIGVVNNASVVRNLASTETRGLDLDLGYQRSTGFGEVSGGLNANYIFEFRQQAASTTPYVDTLNTYLHPVDLQLRGRLGLSRGGFAGSLFVNHTDSYQTDGSAGAVKIDGWTTVDVTAAWSPEAPRLSWLTGTRLSVSVRNLLDEPPPVAPVNEGFRLAGYDPGNASPLMRFVAFEVSKAF